LLWETKLNHLATIFHAGIFICAVGGMYIFNESSPSMLFSCHGSPHLLSCIDSQWKYCKCRSYFSHLNYDELCFEIVSWHTSLWRKHTERLYTLWRKGRPKEFQFITVLFSMKHNSDTADQYWRTVDVPHDVFHIIMFFRYQTNHQRTPFSFYICNIAMKSEAFRFKHSIIYPKLTNIVLGKNLLWMVLLLYPLRSLKATMHLLMTGR
jgi:hypothetical protein